jgi:hypothetical protein
LIRGRFCDVPLGNGPDVGGPPLQGPTVWGIVAFARNKPDHWCRRVNLIGDD